MFYCDYASDYQYGYILPPPAPPSAPNEESQQDDAAQPDEAA